MSASRRERATKFRPNHRLRFNSDLWTKWCRRGEQHPHAERLGAGIAQFRELLEKGAPPVSVCEGTIRVDELLLAINRLRK